MTIEKKRQIAGAAMSAAGCMNYKADVLSPYGVERLRDMTAEQLDDLIQRLNNMNENKTKAAPSIRKARSTVLDLLDSLGIKAKGGNWSQVNAYLMQPRIAGKLLYEMDETELKALARKLRQIMKKAEERDLEAARLRHDN